nr:MAG TPA: Toluene tolerance protein-binding, periplasmic, MlaC, transport, TRANSPORT [Caudoviricetes sp.]
MMKPVMLELGKPFTVENIELQDKGKWGIYNLTLDTKG